MTVEVVLATATADCVAAFRGGDIRIVQPAPLSWWLTQLLNTAAEKHGYQWKEADIPAVQRYAWETLAALLPRN